MRSVILVSVVGMVLVLFLTAFVIVAIRRELRDTAARLGEASESVTGIAERLAGTPAIPDALRDGLLADAADIAELSARVQVMAKGAKAFRAGK